MLKKWKGNSLSDYLLPKGEIILNEENLLGDKKLLTSKLVGEPSDIYVIDLLIDELDEISGLALIVDWNFLKVPSSSVRLVLKVALFINCLHGLHI